IAPPVDRGCSGGGDRFGFSQDLAKGQDLSGPFFVRPAPAHLRVEVPPRSGHSERSEAPTRQLHEGVWLRADEQEPDRRRCRPGERVMNREALTTKEAVVSEREQRQRI